MTDFLKNVWLQGGAAAVLVVMLGYGNWLQWKRGIQKDDAVMTMAKEFGAMAAKASAAADKTAESLDRTTAAFNALSILVAGRGADR